MTHSPIEEVSVPPPEPPPVQASMVVEFPEDRQVTVTLPETDMQALLLLSVVGFGVLAGGYKASRDIIDAVEDAFNIVYAQNELLSLVEGALGDAVNDAFGEGMANKQVDDLLRVFTA